MLRSSDQSQKSARASEARLRKRRSSTALPSPRASRSDSGSRRGATGGARGRRVEEPVCRRQDRRCRPVGHGLRREDGVEVEVGRVVGRVAEPEDRTARGPVAEERASRVDAEVEGEEPAVRAVGPLLRLSRDLSLRTGVRVMRYPHPAE